VKILPIQKTAPTAVAIGTAGSEAELRRQLQTKNGVAELHTGTVRFSQAPTGSFGFIDGRPDEAIRAGGKVGLVGWLRQPTGFVGQLS